MVYDLPKLVSNSHVVAVARAAESELLSGSAVDWNPNLLFAITWAVRPSRAITLLAELPAGSSLQMRTSAAEAIYQTNSAATIPPVLRELDDPDPQVAFAVIEALGNLTRNYEWRPKSIPTGYRLISVP